MSNAMMIALTRRQEDGYDSFNENHYSYRPKAVTVKVHGKIVVYKPEGGMQNVRTA